jgi:hypothetical protein
VPQLDIIDWVNVHTPEIHGVGPALVSVGEPLVVLSHEKHIKFPLHWLFLFIFAFLSFLIRIVFLLFSLLYLFCGHFRAFKHKVLFCLTETYQFEAAYVDMRWDVEFNLAHEISLGIKHQ